MNRGQNQVFYGCLRITTVLLRFPTTSVRCFYEFMPDCAGYDHGRSRFITAVLRSVTVLLRFDTVVLRFLTVVLRLITMPLRFDRYLYGYWRTCHGWLRSSTKGRRSRDGVNKLPSIHIKLLVLLRHSTCPQRRNQWHPKGQGKESGSNVRNRLRASALLPVRMKKRTKFPAMTILWSAVVPLFCQRRTRLNMTVRMPVRRRSRRRNRPLIYRGVP